MEDRNTVLRKWVEALRSGKYKQTHGRLKRRIFVRDNQFEVAYCALGVLCHILADGTEIQETEYDFLVKDSNPHYPMSACLTYLPKWITDQLNIDQYFIVRVNDDQCKPFNKIADVIEAVYLPKKEDTKDATATGS